MPKQNFKNAVPLILGSGNTPSINRQRKILIVDDEPIQLESIQRGLFLYAYDVVGVGSTDEALEFLQTLKGERIDLVVTDLTVPETSGFEFITELKKSRPDLPIVVITGLAIHPAVQALGEQGMVILEKPFRPEQLDQIIRSLIVH